MIETETETETETDPIRTPLELSVRVDPYVPDTPSSLSDVKAMWLSQFDLTSVYKNGSTQRAEDDFRARIHTILQNVVNNGFNTVFLQVRPNADSFYPSAYYPPSKYVVGSYGNDFSYDPVAIVIAEAHELGLSIHAWINPLRGMSDAEIQQIASDYAIRQWYDDKSLRGKYLVKSGSLWYLNPAYAEVRDLIVHGAREILQRYDVDGLHMDDYFYPTQDASFDATAYVDLLIGVTFGKALSKTDQWAGSGKNEWAEHSDILARCITYSLSLEKCKGMSVFCYQYFYDPLSGKEIAGTKAERDNFIVILKDAAWGTP